METKTRNIIIVVVIIAIIAGVGIPLGMIFLAPKYGAVQTGILVTPGAPADVASDRIIKIGVLGSLTEIQGEGQWYGTYLAVDEINTAGGFKIGTDTYYFGLVGEDTFESDAQLDITKGTTAATKMMTQHEPNFCIGGFRTEALLAYQEIVLDEKIIFIDTGASTDIFCQNVIDNYDRYKYFFRTMPINSTTLGGQIITLFAVLGGVMTAALEKPINKVVIVREDLDWTLGMDGALNYYLPLLGWDVLDDIAYPITATSEDFATIWQSIQDLGAQVVIPIISGTTGITFTTQYAQIQAKCLIAGIDVQAQLDSYWFDTNGGCEHEIIMQTLCRTPKTPKSIAFWDNWIDLFGESPLYTAVGSYDTIYMMKDAIEACDSIDSDDLVAQMETVTPENPSTTSVSTVEFGWTESHDVMAGWPYGVTLFVQWQADGAKECITTGGALYPETIVTAPITYPSWGIND